MAAISALPFIALLLCIAALPLHARTAPWWDRHGKKLIVSVGLSSLALLWVALSTGGRPPGDTTHNLHVYGIGAAGVLFRDAMLQSYIPFIVLLFSLYTVAGGILVIEDIPAHSLTNTMILAVGAVLANFIGTTGASMLLIRPLLQINAERAYKSHTVVFFIFIVSNIGGCLTPIGDAPLFLGYLHGVPFFWTTAHLVPIWLLSVASLLIVYFLWDHFYAYPRESKLAMEDDEKTIIPFAVEGRYNLVFLALIVFFVVTIVPGRPWLGTKFIVPMFLREILMLLCTGLSYWLTPVIIRRETNFTFKPIAEVAVLFFGIFITMAAPLERLRQSGSSTGLTHPAGYFWGSGLLSSVLDNAPTYLIFFTIAGATSANASSDLLDLPGGPILVHVLMAISVGTVFMGANTYIGNGPNFIVKKIAEEAGVKMPGFFEYMLYSTCVLLPLYVLITLIYFR